MALFEQKPIHVRRKIALSITFGVALVLITVMIIVYSSDKKRAKNPSETTTAWGHFYSSMVESTRSFFNKERAIIGK